MPAQRKLPPDPDLQSLISSGKLYAEIGRMFTVGAAAVRTHARRLGFDPIPPGKRQGKKQFYRGRQLDPAVDVSQHY